MEFCIVEKVSNVDSHLKIIEVLLVLTTNGYGASEALPELLTNMSRVRFSSLSVTVHSSTPNQINYYLIAVRLRICRCN